MASSTITRDAIDVVLSLSVGDAFTVNGREFVKRSYSTSGYAEADGSDERLVFAVWNAKGQATGVTVRAGYAVEAL